MGVRETRLWGWLKRARQELREDLHMTRVENSVGMGMADVEGCLRGVQFWIELKCSPLPARSTTLIRPKVQSSQPLWHRRRQHAGGRTFVLLQVGSGRSAERFLLNGLILPEFQKGLQLSELRAKSVLSPMASAVAIIEKVIID